MNMLIIITLTLNSYKQIQMRKIFLFLVCMNLIMLVSAQDNKAKRREDTIRKYWFVMLTKGPNRTHDSATAANIQREHLNNITKLYNEGKLKVAGPFGESDKWLGVFIFDCATKEEVEKLLKTDLAVSSGRLAYEIQAWYTAPTGSFEPGIPKVKY